MSTWTPTRIERDSLGEYEVPADAYYGIHTARAIENFSISGWRPYPSLVTATVQVKKAAARANKACGVLDPRIADAIETAADEVLEGTLRDQFVVDPFQAGAGTSHNMNANEVLANRAIELLGGQKGDYSLVHPNDHVNMSQSTNDVFPTAMRLACLELLAGFLPALKSLETEFSHRAGEFDEIVKAGRTHLQDAVPIRLGQEFGAYAASLGKHFGRIGAAAGELSEIGLGGTAVGTGLNAPPDYRRRVIEELASISGYTLRATEDYFESMQSLAPFVSLSGALKGLATDLSRIASDLRLLASGPRTGLAEARLPAVQAGSSIMPGKVNPVIPEMTNMVCFQVIGNDAVITLAAQAGQLELNVMMPVVAFDILMSLTITTNALRVLGEKCVVGIQADAARCRWYSENSVALVTALSPKLGYEKTAEIVGRALSEGRTIREMVVAAGFMDADEVERLLDTRTLTEYNDGHQKA